MDDSVNVITSVWEKGKNIRPNTLFNIKKSIIVVQCINHDKLSLDKL